MYKHYCYIFKGTVNLSLSKRLATLMYRTSSEWKSVVGLEVHAQIASASKLFSSAGTEFASPVNTNVNLFDAAIPGTLPRLNKKCVESAVLIAKVLTCEINRKSHFDRKHYFYSDLPAGYQITQQRSPIARNGQISFYVYTPGIHKEPYEKSSLIKQIQLEQDSGKSLHDEKFRRTLIDLNRAGVPLLEFVFEPDLTDGEEAAALVKELSQILRRTNVCSCKMEEGALRVDANVSVHKPGESLGVRTEIKNIGSVRGVANAVNYEIERQIALLKEGDSIVNETRTWDAVSKKTVAMRDKEEKQDYRFIPEPNLPPLCLRLKESDVQFKDNALDVIEIFKQAPKLPKNDREDLMKKYGLNQIQALNIVNMDELLYYFKALMKDNEERSATRTADFLLYDFLSVMYKYEIDLLKCPVTIHDIGRIIDLVESQDITTSIGVKLLEEKVLGSPSSLKEIIIEKDWGQISDPKEIEKICLETMEKNPKFVRKYKDGKAKMFVKLLRHIDQNTQGRANMKMVVAKLTELLGSNK